MLDVVFYALRLFSMVFVVRRRLRFVLCALRFCALRFCALRSVGGVLLGVHTTEGSFGVVYKGIYLPTKAVVAVKVLELDEDETFDDLVAEIEFLRSCSSPYVVKYYGSYKRDHELFVSDCRCCRVFIFCCWFLSVLCLAAC